jgi:acyl-coenzyme A thioesterase PaaI-like protein
MGMLAGMVLGAGILLCSASSASAEEALNAVAIAQHLDKTKYTTTEVKNYIKDLKGKQVIAQGKLHEVLTGKTGNIKVVVYVDVPNKSTYFIVDTIVEDASGLHKNDRITCTGEYIKYNPFSLNGITIKGSCKK